MKKVIAMVMCVAMIACIAMTASAATAATFTIDDVKDAKVGDVILVNMSIAEKGTRIGAIGFTFDYDDTYLKFVENEDEGKYFVVGGGAGGATAAGNEETMEVQMATADGFFKADVVLTLAFEVIAEIPQEGTVISAEMTTEAKSAESDNVTYDVKINNGTVYPVIEEDVPSEVPPTPGTDEDVTPTDKPSKPAEEDKKPTENPKTGDASAVAVAAGLCAVMAAAFVITKKVND